MTALSVPTKQLNSGADIPVVGFGTFQVDPEITREVVLSALGQGYRSIDTAARYLNEAEVGEAIAEAAVPRDELFVSCHSYHRPALRMISENSTHASAATQSRAQNSWISPLRPLSSDNESKSMA